MIRSRIPNIKVDDQKVEVILRAILKELENPIYRGDIEFMDSSRGVILLDELGGRWRVTIDSTGTLVQTQL